MSEDNNFDNFEQFLQSEADNQKMYPSDTVWSSISKQIQTKKSWPALTIISAFILGTLSVATLLNYPPENPLNKFHFSVSNHQANTNIHPAATNQTFKENVQGNLLVTNSQSAKSGYCASTNIHQFKKANFTFNHSFYNLADIDSHIQENSNGLLSSNYYLEPQKHFELGKLSNIENSNTIGQELVINKRLKKSNPVLDDETPNELNNLKGKLDYEVYGTPSFSFRTLSEDKAVNGGVGTSSANNKVRQIAGLGSELGVGLRYKTSLNFTLKFGLQFNIRQYYIDAHNSQGLATIEVLQNNKLDSINVASKYSNNFAGADTRLNNRLYQVSIPIGLEWNAFHSKHLGLSLSASIQPTYSLNKNVYIISTDYKYYTNGESLFRKWNVNSAVSANISYKLKNTTLYLGPQIRYQHLPTYVDKYPIKEYRVDYGVRVGIIKSIR